MSMRINTSTAIALAGVLGLCAVGQAADPNMENNIGDPSGFFSSDYMEARQKFLDAVLSVGASTDNFRNPNAGPAGDDLFTDVALLGPKDAETILVLGSGTHGVEGFAGSGVQTGLLRSGVLSNLKPKTSVLLIHAINPYGFAHLRRWNEDGVDLNRNFVDHSKPYPANPGYEELADDIAPDSVSVWANAKSILRLLGYALRNGKVELKEAITGGQHMHPKGLFFRGREEAWSNKTLKKIADKYLSSAKKVVVVDFHTGLGPFGHAEVILNEPKDSLSHKRAVEWWGDRVRTTASGKSVSVHLEGTVKLAFPKFLPYAEVTAVSLEFGTLAPLKVIWALRNENWMHHYGGKDHPDKEAFKAKLLWAFYPNTDDWKTRVWGHGKEVVEQALAHLQTGGT